MRIGIISPIKFLKDYCKTDVQYILPRLLVEESEYRDFYISREEEGDTLILDCRIPHWKRTPEDFDVIEKALGIISPHIIVAPSHMFNSKASDKTFRKFISKVPCGRSRIIRCIEGTSPKDITHSGDYPQAIPSHMFRYLDILPTDAIYIENHLDPNELLGRKGILVTSLPIRLGLQGRLLFDFKPTPDSLTFYEKENLYPKITMRNVKDIIEMYEEE